VGGCFKLDTWNVVSLDGFAAGRRGHTGSPGAHPMRKRTVAAVELHEGQEKIRMSRVRVVRGRISP
jgi:hypothetical protein